ncbi:MAG: YcxB family protein [Planctomycetaceae bacterium]
MVDDRRGGDVYRAVYGAAEGAKRKKLDTPQELEITEDGFRLIVGDASSAFRAASFEKLIESDRLFSLKCKELLVFVPKRVFASDTECDAFRALARAWSEVGQEPGLHADLAEDSADAVSVEFRLRFRDYIDRTLQSWLSRSLCGLFLLMTFGTFVYSGLKPVPGAVVSHTEIMVYYLPPILVIQTLFLFSVCCVRNWLHERSSLGDMRATFSDSGIECVTERDISRMGWLITTRFKESPWSFFVWWPGTRGWIMIPKRAFASQTEMQQCRGLLVSRAEASTWFWW